MNTMYMVNHLIEALKIANEEIHNLKISLENQNGYIRQLERDKDKHDMIHDNCYVMDDLRQGIFK